MYIEKFENMIASNSNLTGILSVSKANVDPTH